ncbi:MAG TPA: aminoglycoside phosphotransferase family protein [Jatrophihabitans sp.]|uniref:phosphotransferase family protein n=1 Tax=Jatrophihabitans sp. TaxID=1932789 RepID=UPI002F13BFE2
MDFSPVERAPEAFQQSVTADQVVAMCRRAFGADVGVSAAVELGLGAYNSTYRVELDGRAPVILRVAPEPARQFRIERELMRNEHATVPYLAGFGELLPRTLAVDFTHQLLGRDYLFQTLLGGVPAPDGLGGYPRPAWAGFYGQLGSIARAVHDVRGERFGPVAGPAYDTWSQALIGYFTDAAADLEDAGLDAEDVRRLAGAAARRHAVLDEISEPRLLHGDLWTVNVLLDPAAAEPTITGVVDCDRGWWGDPLADWTIYRAIQREGAERAAFFNGYGPLPATAGDELRARFYLARHLVGVRLERFRLAEPGVADTYEDMREVLSTLE